MSEQQYSCLTTMVFNMYVFSTVLVVHIPVSLLIHTSPLGWDGKTPSNQTMRDKWLTYSGLLATDTFSLFGQHLRASSH